jgi:hypothetical protein
MIMLTAGGCPPGQGGLRSVAGQCKMVQDDAQTSERGTGLQLQSEYLALDLSTTPDCN